MSEFKAISVESRPKSRCLSCGTSENLHNRRYCSIRCRQILRQRLNARNGLLQALNARWAAFYFTDTMIYLDVAARGYRDIFRFSYVRTDGGKPSEDFSRLANALGKAWWEEEKKSRRKYLASRHVLTLAQKIPVTSSVHPKVTREFYIQQRILSFLGIKKEHLNSADLKTIIKNAYRRQAKIHHPDRGGHAASFRKINAAYQELLRWAENPHCVKRRGFTDRWFYDGENKRWVQPLPLHKKR